MIGTKVRSFSSLSHDVSLEDLVPEDNFFRRLEAGLDLSFVRELVAPLYVNGGRPSVDPVVFFKLQLVIFFEDIRSERRLMYVVADRLSVRWYVSYDLFEPLPDHSSLTRIRERYGLLTFRRFFERIVEECIEAVLWCGARNSFSTRPRSRPTPLWRAASPGSRPRPTWAGSSGTRGQTSPKQETRPQSPTPGPISRPFPRPPASTPWAKNGRLLRRGHRRRFTPLLARFSTGWPLPTASLTRIGLPSTILPRLSRVERVRKASQKR
jgi:transposase